MWQSVPWFVAGGLHAPEVARLLAYAATGGKGGVVGAADCQVQDLAVPGVGVQVMPGGVVIPNAKTGGEFQTYLGRNPVAEMVAMTAVGSGGPRTDLIIARIEDPQYPGTLEPADRKVGPYIFTRVIEGVPASTTRVQQIAGHENDSAETLARVTRGASTGTVLQSHITDLRKLAQPRAERILNAVDLPEPPELLNSTVSPHGEAWPNPASWQVEIPEWATKAAVVATWGQVLFPAGNTTGFVFARLGAVEVALAPVVGRVTFDSPGSTQPSRNPLICAGTVAIPKSLRGTTVNAHLRGLLTAGATTVRPRVDSASSCALDIQFIESPEAAV